MESYERVFLGLAESPDVFDQTCKNFDLSALFYKNFDAPEHLQTLYLIKAVLWAFDHQDLAFENPDHVLHQITRIYQQNDKLQKAYFLAFYLLTSVFLRQNYLGKEYAHQDAEKKVRKADQAKLNVPKKEPIQFDFQPFTE